MKEKSISHAELRKIALKYERIFRELLLVRGWFANKDFVVRKLVNSSQAASQKLKMLKKNKIVKKHENGYVLVDGMIKKLDKILPPRDDLERTKRRMARDFDLDLNLEPVRNNHADKIKGRSKIPKPNLDRPDWHFDVKAVIHPALVCDDELRISDYSTSFEQLITPIIPDFLQNYIEGKIKLKDFLKELNLFHFDYNKLSCTDTHILDRYLEQKGFFDVLQEKGMVDQLPCVLRNGDQERYFHIFCVTQKRYQGLQSMWTSVDKRIIEMRLIRTLRTSKTLIAAHRLKQPANLFNASRALLDIFNGAFLDAHGTEVKGGFAEDLKEIIEYMTIGIKDFASYCNALQLDEYNIDMKSFDEQTDIISMLRALYEEMDAIHASPKGVKLIIAETAKFSQEHHIIKTNSFLMREALFNLIHNAIKHGGKGHSEPKVFISFDSSPKGLQINIEDNGEGLNTQSMRNLNDEYNGLSHRFSVPGLGAVSGIRLAMSVIKSSSGDMTFKPSSKGGLGVEIKFN